MNPRIALITILSDDVPRLRAFYEKVLGFKPKLDYGHYIEFESEGVRFALCARSVLKEATGDRGYDHPASGHSFELAFPVSTPADVDATYKTLIASGAAPVKAPADMPWGQRTAFFADPDGNIHEIFANKSQ